MSIALPISRRLHLVLMDIGGGKVRLRLDSSEPECEGAIAVCLVPGMIIDDGRSLEIDIAIADVRITPKP